MTDDPEEALTIDEALEQARNIIARFGDEYNLDQGDDDDDWSGMSAAKRVFEIYARIRKT